MSTAYATSPTGDQLCTPFDGRAAGGAGPQMPAGGRPQVGGADPLGNNAESSGSTPCRTTDPRVARWAMLGVTWDVTRLERVAKCGRCTVTAGGEVAVRRRGSTVGYAGLASCGSVWACPRCSAKIAAERRAEIVAAVLFAIATGLRVAFVTQTLRHDRGQSLDELFSTLRLSSAAVTQSRKVRAVRESMRYIGAIKTTEVTHGGNGWHPHVHALYFFDGPVDPVELDGLIDAEFSVWARRAVKAGLGSPTREQMKAEMVSTEVRDAEDVGRYLSKSEFDPARLTVHPEADPAKLRKLGFEMTGSQTKKGRRGGRTPWQILADFAATGDLDDLDLWHEYEAATKGRRQVVWSAGLKARFGVAEREDAEIAEDEVGTSEDDQFTITDWAAVIRRPRVAGELLTVLAVEGGEAARAFCAREGIPIRDGSPFFLRGEGRDDG